MNKLQEFIKEITEMTVIQKDRDYRFVLARWSKDQPEWCVFACEYRNPNTKNSSIGIGGQFCIGKEGLHDVLSTLADSGWKTEVCQYFFHDEWKGEGDK